MKLRILLSSEICGKIFHFCGEMVQTNHFLTLQKPSCKHLKIYCLLSGCDSVFFVVKHLRDNLYYWTCPETFKGGML